MIVFNRRRTTKWVRFKYWLSDTWNQIVSLPHYLWPTPLQPTPLTEEEKAWLKKIDDEDKKK